MFVGFRAGTKYTECLYWNKLYTLTDSVDVNICTNEETFTHSSSNTQLLAADMPKYTVMVPLLSRRLKITETEAKVQNPQTYVLPSYFVDREARQLN